jgi:hypothetical protein
LSARAASQPGSPSGTQYTFALERFERLLRRRLQVVLAVEQVSSTAALGRLWLVRALDSAIADEYLQLQRFGKQDDARDLLASFRQALENLDATSGRAA